ncbi:MAG: hypothetical protein RDV48_19945 [Candidatus Eremiobacteraeota bacterium]|nr:hypothetical protein [Candidatus Eremiobacteraeota bacterium]
MKQIRITYFKTGPKNWRARTPDLSGYFAGDETLEGLRKLVYEGIPFFVGEPVEITETFDDSCGQKTA